MWIGTSFLEVDGDDCKRFLDCLYSTFIGLLHLLQFFTFFSLICSLQHICDGFARRSYRVSNAERSKSTQLHIASADELNTHTAPSFVRVVSLHRGQKMPTCVLE